MTWRAAAILLALGALALAAAAWAINNSDHPRAPVVLPADHVMPPP